MSLYAIGDLHLHFESELKSKNQIEEKIWKNHEILFQKNCQKMINDDDTLVLVGDHSWGMKLENCTKDLEYISALPGRKILVRGNHDKFWNAKKTAHLNEIFKGKLEFLQNNYFTYEDYALVGTKGYTFEGPYYLNHRGQMIGWDEEEFEHSQKVVQRELERLRQSFESAKAAGYTRFIMFLHYPPTNILEEHSGFTEMAEEYGAEQVIYAHCHGESRFHDSIQGDHNGIRYSLVSGDYLGWKPWKIM